MKVDSKRNIKVFDKKDRSMVESWRVVVREKEKKVNLYCPECWDFAQKIVLEALGNEKEE